MKWVALTMASVVGVVSTLTVAHAQQDSGRGALAGKEHTTINSPTRKVDLNVASIREIQELPGFGPELAERVVQHRPYHKLDELIARKVLGRKEFARIKERIRVKPAAEKNGLRNVDRLDTKDPES